MKKIKGALIVISMICFSISNVVASNSQNIDAQQATDFQNKDSSNIQTPSTDDSDNKKDVINNVKSFEQTELLAQPTLGDNQVFGLWIHLIYNDKEITQEININPWWLKGKLTDPGYRTPIAFDIDDDPEDDLEIGFGFYKYGIDIEDESHSAWATTLDFTQINNQLDDQLGSFEVWQEFHVNLALIKNAGLDVSSLSTENLHTRPISEHTKTKLGFLKDHMTEKFNVQKDKNLCSLLNAFIQTIPQSMQKHCFNPQLNSKTDPQQIAANEDYIVTRVGYRSPAGQKIPIRFEKTFAVSKGNIFRPYIFQHELNPYDIVGVDSIDAAFGFQAYEQGSIDPSYNIEFSFQFNPAVYLVTQFTPRSGRAFYYYHSATAQQTDISLCSNVIVGGDQQEEQEGSISVTVSLDSVPNDLIGPGKWMCFDIDALGDLDPLDGFIHYSASHEFDVGLQITSSRFEEKVVIQGIPQTIDLSWHLGIDIAGTSMLMLSVDGFVSLDMSNTLEKVIIYYPKTNPEDSEIPFLSISDIPSSETIGAEGTLYVDTNDFTNPANYVFGKIYHDHSDNLGSIQLCLPYEEIPIFEVSDIPSDASVQGRLEWNNQKGYVSAERWSSGNPDPVTFHLSIDSFTIDNVLEIGDGYIQGDFNLASNGYLGFDTSEKMFSDTFEFRDSATGTLLSVSVDEVSAENLWLDWILDTSGEELTIEDIGFHGFLKTLKDFEIAMCLDGKNCSFTGDWDLGESGSFEIEFYQNEPVVIDFDLDDYSEDFDLHGTAILTNELHFDMSWKWKKGQTYLDPGFFTINENHNQPNFEALDIYFTYQDQYGVNVTCTDTGIYLSCEWWRNGLIPYIWLVFDIMGDIDFDLLWNGEWYYNVEE